MIFSIALSLVVLILSISYACYRIAFYSPQKGREDIPTMSGHEFDSHRDTMRRIFTQLAARDYEPVSIVSHDGLRLAGKYYHVRDGAPVSIVFHGYRSHSMTDCAGGSELVFEMGHNLLLIDQRSHGSSQGRSITLGILEREDCINWVRYVLDRFGADTQILLYGISMGAATVLMASGLDLPENVKAIIADCPYSSPGEIVKKWCKNMHFAPSLMYPFIYLGAAIFGKFNLHAVSPENAVRSANTPILIIHGGSDTLVPPQMSQKIADACPDLVQRQVIPDAEHGISFLVDEVRYKQMVKQFVLPLLNESV